jgi:nicotinate-nucleotide--dimethylbenzimidazole phosphoribosyltransferase
MSDEIFISGQSLSLPKVQPEIQRLEAVWRERAAQRQLTLTKPPGSLGQLEELANRLAALQQTVQPALRLKRIYVVAADHGVTAEGVSPYPREVTAQMVENFLRGGAAINVLARQANIEVKVVDAGVDADLSAHHELLHEKLMRGTANFAHGPAMSRAQAEQCVTTGLRLAQTAQQEGVDCLGIGEMGIGNTAVTSAITVALTGGAIEAATGRGTGLDDAGLLRKQAVIARALEINQPDARDALDILHKVGGAEIGVMMGLFVGATAARLPVVADGFISTAAAALAVQFCPAVKDVLFLAHRSVEPGHAALIEFIGLEPLLDLQMRLGEGTGAALAMHLLDAAARCLSEMATFAQAGVSERTEATP